HRYRGSYAPESRLSCQHPPQIDRHSPACIAMQPRRNHQARFFTIWTGKDAGNRQEGAETR
ncbi:hypothetical protein DT417_RS27325, partial [Escherichia coli]